MGKYLVQARYTASAYKGMIDNPHDRESAITSLVRALDISVDSLYFAPASGEAIMIIDSDTQKNAALLMIVMSSGSLTHPSITELISSADMKSAMDTGNKLASQYNPANS